MSMRYLPNFYPHQIGTQIIYRMREAMNIKSNLLGQHDHTTILSVFISSQFHHLSYIISKITGLEMFGLDLIPT